jgi:hypothetical protein
MADDINTGTLEHISIIDHSIKATVNQLCKHPLLKNDQTSGDYRRLHFVLWLRHREKNRTHNPVDTSVTTYCALILRMN